MDNPYCSYEEREFEIDPVDLFFKLLIQWKAILLVCILMSLLISGVKFINDKKEYEVSLEKHRQLSEFMSLSEKERTEKVLAPLSKEDRAAVLFIIDQEELLEQEHDVLNNSILFSNPSNQRQLIMSFLINNSESSNMQTLSDMYTTCLHNNSTIAALKEIIDPQLSDDYISELIITSSDDVSKADSKATDMVYSVAIVLPEDVDSNAVSDVISSMMNDATEEISSIAGAHNLQKTNETDTHVYSKELAEEKRAIAAHISSLNSNIKTAMDSLSDEQQIAYSSIKEIKIYSCSDITTKDALAVPKSPGFSKKYVVIGFFLGVFLYATMYIMLLIIKKQLVSVSTAQSYICTRILGEIYKTKKRTCFLKILTSEIILKWRYKDKLNIAAQTEAVSETIDAICNHRNLKALALLKSGVDDSFTDIVNIIVDKCKTNRMAIDFSILDYDRMSEKELSHIHDAIYVVSNTTQIEKLDAIMHLCNDYDITAIGTIYTEAL